MMSIRSNNILISHIPPNVLIFTPHLKHLSCNFTLPPVGGRKAPRFVSLINCGPEEWSSLFRFSLD